LFTPRRGGSDVGLASRRSAVTTTRVTRIADRRSTTQEIRARLP